MGQRYGSYGYGSGYGNSFAGTATMFGVDEAADQLRKANREKEGYVSKGDLSRFANDHFANVDKADLQPIVDQIWNQQHEHHNWFARAFLGRSEDITPDNAERARREVVDLATHQLHVEPEAPIAAQLDGKADKS